jgi:NAD(P)-dependent dehydrogenase (short-subunit alcohol dehydrogenase family)
MITGASSGIGAACALRLDGMGYAVFAGVRKSADGDRLAAQASTQLTPVIIDVTDAESVVSAARTFGEHLGDAGLDGLVNNAGIAVAGPLEVLPLESFRRQLEVNVIGQLAVTQAFAPLLRKVRGRIVNMSSISGKVTLPMLGPYATSKFALEAMSDALRMELCGSGVSVTLIEPGTVITPIWDRSTSQANEMIDALPEAHRERYRPLIVAMEDAAAKAQKKAVSADDVARVVVKALTARRPKTRYLVGTDARLMAHLLRRLPDRWRDLLILRWLGLRGA